MARPLPYRAAPVTSPLPRAIFIPQPPCSNPRKLTDYDRDRLRYARELDEAEMRVRREAAPRRARLDDRPSPAVTRAGGLRGGAANRWQKYRNINK